MADVFISYASESFIVAKKIADELDRAGISRWFAPQNVKGAQEFPVEIHKAIQDCKIFLLVLDKNSQQSEYVKSEVTLAFRRKDNKEAIALLPFNIDGCKLSPYMDVYFNHHQIMDGNPPDTQHI